LILAFDTSCDDTSVACFIDKNRYSNIVSSQNEIHRKYGGIMPEMAARKHIESIGFLTREALESSDVLIDDVEIVAVTVGPGLLPSLLVGVSFAKGLAFANKKKIMPINHIEGHLFAPFFDKNEIDFPFMSLIVSGGHTHLFLVEGVGRYKLIGKTLDDAVGEAFDKVARVLDVGYPGGPVIDRLSKDGNPYRYNIPMGLDKKKTFDFSFSGTKTYVKNLVNNSQSLSKTDICDIAASFQKSSVEILWKKAYSACQFYNVHRLAVSGGVSANSLLRSYFQKESVQNGIELFLPNREMTTDNALMIAFAAYLKKDEASYNYLLIEANPRLKIY
jgi:N6-L-threonylcarbamoyladenine synthase